MKSKIELSMVLTALMLVAVFTGIPMVKADWPPEFEQFGPHIDVVLTKLYATESVEFQALEAGEIDMADWPLTKYWIDRWAGNPEINMMDYGGEIGAFEIDINQNATKADSYSGGAIPGTQEDNIGRLFEFRHAVAHLVNRPIIIQNILQGFGVPMYTMVPPALGGWVNPLPPAPPPLDLKHPYNPFEGGWGAADILNAADIRDHDGDGYRDWPLSIYPTPKRVEIDFTIRDDHTPGRREIGALLVWELTDHLAAVDPTGGRFWVNRWSAWGVMGARRWFLGKSFTLYTGGWILGRNPDFLFFLYHSSQYWHPGRPPNHANVHDPTLDAFLEGIQYAESYSQAMVNTQAAQEWMAANVFVIPIYTSSAPKAARTRYTGGTNGVPVLPDDGENLYRGLPWKGFVNQYGFGLNSWWSFLNAHPEAYELPAAGKPMVLRCGLKVPEFSSLNPIYAEWECDWEVLGRVYEGLIAVNPYNLAEDLEWVAKRWEVGVWTTPTGEGATQVTFELRDDVYWHDGQQLDADDLIFTFAELDDLLRTRVLPPPWFYSKVMDIYDVVKVSQFKVRVRFNVKSYFTLHWIGEAPILPEHVWRPIILSGDPDTFAPDKHIIGAGPFKAYPHSIDTVDNDYYVPYSHLVLDVNRGYFNGQPIFASMATHGSTIDVYLQNRHNSAVSLSVTVIANGTSLIPTTPGPYMVPACSGSGPGVYTVKFCAPPSKGTYDVTATVNYNFGEQAISDTFALRLLAPSVDGDTTNDGSVNIFDAIHLTSHYGLKAWVWPEDDVNADNQVDLIDAIILMQHYGETDP